MSNIVFTGSAGFSYKGYYYWFSVIDCVYYKQKRDSFVKEEITKEEYDQADEDQYYFLKD